MNLLLHRVPQKIPPNSFIFSVLKPSLYETRKFKYLRMASRGHFHLYKENGMSLLSVKDYNVKCRVYVGIYSAHDCECVCIF